MKRVYKQVIKSGGSSSGHYFEFNNIAVVIAKLGVATILWRLWVNDDDNSQPQTRTVHHQGFRRLRIID